MSHPVTCDKHISITSKADTTRKHVCGPWDTPDTNEEWKMKMMGNTFHEKKPLLGDNFSVRHPQGVTPFACDIRSCRQHP